MVPPSFAGASWHQPLRVLAYSHPITEGSRQRSTFAFSDFFSQLQGLFHSVSTYGFSTAHPLSGCDEQLLLAPSKPLLYYYFVRFSLGAGAEPLPEREDTSPPERVPCLGQVILANSCFSFLLPQATKMKNNDEGQIKTPFILSL